MVDVETELSRISDFIGALDLAKSARVDIDDVAKDVYRKFHALLAWQVVLSKDSELKKNGAFDEFLSDSASSYFLHLTSSYKPCISMLRSGVENLVRTLLLIEGASVDNIDAVWELFAVARSHFLAKSADWNVIRIDALHARYGEMCKTVHSASPEYMSLRVPFERIFEFDQKIFASTQTLIRDVFRLSLESIFLIAHEKLSFAHHRIADEIRDAISPSTKALISKG